VVRADPSRGSRRLPAVSPPDGGKKKEKKKKKKKKGGGRAAHRRPCEEKKKKRGGGERGFVPVGGPMRLCPAAAPGRKKKKKKKEKTWGRPNARPEVSRDSKRNVARKKKGMKKKRKKKEKGGGTLPPLRERKKRSSPLFHRGRGGKRKKKRIAEKGSPKLYSIHVSNVPRRGGGGKENRKKKKNLHNIHKYTKIKLLKKKRKNPSARRGGKKKKKKEKKKGESIQHSRNACSSPSFPEERALGRVVSIRFCPRPMGKRGGREGTVLTGCSQVFRGPRSRKEKKKRGGGQKGSLESPASFLRQLGGGEKGRESRKGGAVHQAVRGRPWGGEGGGRKTHVRFPEKPGPKERKRKKKKGKGTVGNPGVSPIFVPPLGQGKPRGRLAPSKRRTRVRRSSAVVEPGGGGGGGRGERGESSSRRFLRAEEKGEGEEGGGKGPVSSSRLGERGVAFCGRREEKKKRGKKEKREKSCAGIRSATTNCNPFQKEKEGRKRKKKGKKETRKGNWRRNPSPIALPNFCHQRRKKKRGGGEELEYRLPLFPKVRFGKGEKKKKGRDRLADAAFFPFFITTGKKKEAKDSSTFCITPQPQGKRGGKRKREKNGERKKTKKKYARFIRTFPKLPLAARQMGEEGEGGKKEARSTPPRQLHSLHVFQRSGKEKKNLDHLYLLHLIPLHLPSLKGGGGEKKRGGRHTSSYFLSSS